MLVFWRVHEVCGPSGLFAVFFILMLRRVPHARCVRCGHAVRLGLGWCRTPVPMNVAPKGHSITMGGQWLCLGRNNNVGVQEWAAGHLVHSKILVLRGFASFAFHRTYGNEC